MGDFQLTLELRAFHIVPTPTPSAEVAMTAKLLDGTGRVIDAMAFSDNAPIATTDDAGIAADGLNAAYDKVTTEMVAWALASMKMAETSPPSPQSPASDPATDGAAGAAQPLRSSAPLQATPRSLTRTAPGMPARLCHGSTERLYGQLDVHASGGGGGGSGGDGGSGGGSAGADADASSASFGNGTSLSA